MGCKGGDSWLFPVTSAEDVGALQTRTLAYEIKQPSHVYIWTREHKMRAEFSLTFKMASHGYSHLQKMQDTKQKAERGHWVFKRKHISPAHLQVQGTSHLSSSISPFPLPFYSSVLPKSHAGSHQEANDPAEILQDIEQSSQRSCRSCLTPEWISVLYSRCPCGSLVPSMK